ncbi:hypothetical protein VM1G_05879 [Cytospora mali]|uniref:Uncharacterized protein n=1 Tax=Cytospora mali TaxID=578113 RepID=A0A194W1M8_CYTMA|nr:hypothetical protein VM1G_05879 [Valsa mali]
MSLLDLPPPSYDSSVRRSKSDRSSRRSSKPKKYVADTIDQLDTTSFGGPYHHGGPYDATLRSFNVNKHYSPVAAVKEGNKAAWEATPREAQLDALLKGRPLDGVASVPPGERALNGEIMEYEYGTDMFRDPDAGGGAYNRWPGLKYHPDDLKGKAEPGFTIDRERKAREAAGVGRSQSVRERRGEYEMVPQRPRGDSDGRKRARSPPVFSRLGRDRSSSAAATTSLPKEIAEGLKRRIGSLRRK